MAAARGQCSTWCGVAWSLGRDVMWRLFESGRACSSSECCAKLRSGHWGAAHPGAAAHQGAETTTHLAARKGACIGECLVVEDEGSLDNMRKG